MHMDSVCQKIHHSPYKPRQTLGRSSALPGQCRVIIISIQKAYYFIYTKACLLSIQTSKLIYILTTQLIRFTEEVSENRSLKSSHSL